MAKKNGDYPDKFEMNHPTYRRQNEQSGVQRSDRTLTENLLIGVKKKCSSSAPRSNE